MIRLADGSEWGTAAEIAAHLGPDVSRAMVRFWVRTHHLTRIEITKRDVRYNLAECVEVERAVRGSGRGRPRAA